MAAWSLAEIRLDRLSGLRGYWVILAMALKPLMWKIDIVYHALLVSALTVGLVVSAFTLGGAPPPSAPPPESEDVLVTQSWIRAIERRLEDHERRLQNKTARQDLTDQRLSQNDEFHRDLNALHMGSRLAVLESTVSLFVKTQIAILLVLIPVAWDSLKRIWKR